MELNFDIEAIATPCYIVDEALLLKNLETLNKLKERTGCKILLAQKAFSMYSLYPLIRKYLDGTTASGLYEARLGFEEFGGETHVYSPAYREDEFDELLGYAGHFVFNSFTQWDRYGTRALAAGKKCLVRVNPEHSTQEHGVYDPCSAGSRLGVTKRDFPDNIPMGISGLHFHTLCEQNSDAFVETLAVFEAKFGKQLRGLEVLNIGGGHHITRADYDMDRLADAIMRLKREYNVEVYIEPGEAVALNAGFLVSTVLETLQNGMDIAILDASAACHMPDVLEMPYRPEIIGAGLPNEKPYTYRLGGNTCLAGDIIGDYSFDKPLKAGDRLVFCDMAHYSMVKNNTFNGMALPSIMIAHENGELELVKRFDYGDFKRRL